MCNLLYLCALFFVVSTYSVPNKVPQTRVVQKFMPKSSLKLQKKYPRIFSYSLKEYIIICPGAIVLHGTDYKTTFVVLSVCLCSYSCNLYLILMKFCTEVAGLKSKNTFVRGSKFDDPFPYFAQVYHPSVIRFQWECPNSTVMKPVD